MEGPLQSSVEKERGELGGGPDALESKKAEKLDNRISATSGSVSTIIDIQNSPQTPPTSEQETLPTPLPSGDVYQEKNEHNRLSGLGMRISNNGEATAASTSFHPINPSSNERVLDSTNENKQEDDDDREEEEDDDDDISLDSSPSRRKSRLIDRTSTLPPIIPSSPTRASPLETFDLKPEPQIFAEQSQHPTHNLPTSWRNPPPEPTTANEFISLTDEDINSLSESSVRQKLSRATKTIQEYRSALRKYESLIAHYKLQNKLLTIETHEAAQRHEVETSIAKREVDRLRIEALAAARAAANASSSAPNATSAFIPGSLDDPDNVEIALEIYKRRLRKTRSKLKDITGQLEDKDMEIERLRRRLRDMSSGFKLEPPGPLGPSGPSGPSVSTATTTIVSAPGPAPYYRTSTPGEPTQPSSTPTSPSRNLQTPFTHIPPQQVRESSSASDDSGHGLSALEMLASQVLSRQRIPSSPLGRQQQPELRVPPTPSRRQSHGLMSPLEFSESSSSTLHPLPLPLPLSPEKRRRESSASTITISSNGEDEDTDPRRQVKDEKQRDDGATTITGLYPSFNSGAETDIEDDDDEEEIEVDNDGTDTRHGNGRRVPVPSESSNNRTGPGSPKKYIRQETNNSTDEDKSSVSSNKRLPIGRILDFGN